ncbi:MAG: chromate efflux transporter [Alphaproteobacteria bacterium]|nr:chromate efflux transporter [Alphaproteobacteria bacterium]
MPEHDPGRSSPLEILAVFLRLGMTSFGGPVAHLGYYRNEFIERRGWLDEAGFADLLALAQFLPGPTSSEFGFAVGLLRAGLPGALCAWIGFTLPSALIMGGLGFGIARLGHLAGAAWLHGLMLVACAVVALAVWTMARRLANDVPRGALALAAAGMTLALPLPPSWGQLFAIAFGAAVGRLFLPGDARQSVLPFAPRVPRALAIASLVLFAVLLTLSPILAATTGSNAVRLFDGFYRSGSLVFGGGHVLLPLLDAVVVPKGWVSQDTFLAGYGAAQALPGPLFTFAAFLGVAMQVLPGGLVGGAVALVAIFLPGSLLILGTLPFWSELRRNQAMQSTLKGVNAAVVGLLLAVLYRPVFVSAVFGWHDFAFAAAALILLRLRMPPWAVVVLGALGGEALARLA